VICHETVLLAEQRASRVSNSLNTYLYQCN